MKTTIIHGVFLNIFNHGILITGPSKIGKSALALNLITRGHQLIADDAPEFSKTAENTLIGQCPNSLQDCLAVHPLGILNIRQLYGNTAIYRSQTLHFVVNLTYDELPTDDEMSLINGYFRTTTILDVAIPQLPFSTKHTNAMPLLVETAIRHYFKINRDTQ